MKSLFKRLAALAALSLALMNTAGADTPPPATATSTDTCTGKFMNPITDVCWSCIFPLSIGSTTILQMGQEDIENVGSPICQCGVFPFGKIGVSIGFWEPARQVDVTRTPWCFPSLGGKKIGSGKSVPHPSVSQGNKGRRASNTSLYQAHWYVNPVLYWLEVLSESSCLEQAGFDIAYVTELDPSWNDDELAVILSPDVFLFANPAAQAACAADCVAATIGFPLSPMQWCGGCQGSMFPLNGHVQSHVSGPQASSLILQRYAMKLHREFWPSQATASRAGAACIPPRCSTSASTSTRCSTRRSRAKDQTTGAASRWDARPTCGARAKSTRSRGKTSPT